MRGQVTIPSEFQNAAVVSNELIKNLNQLVILKIEKRYLLNTSMVLNNSEEGPFLSDFQLN